MYRQPELFAISWGRKLRQGADVIWRHWLTGWVLIACSGLLYLFWAYNIPSPGKAVAALAVIAAVMTFRGEIGGLEKFFWMIILFAFLFMELRAIDRDRAIYAKEQEKARKEEATAFGTIGDGIKTAITMSEDQFKETVSQQSRNFDATMKKSQVTIDEVTGGSSYAIVFPDLTPRAVPTFPLTVTVCNKCQYGVPHARIYLQPDTASGDPGALIYEGPVDPDAGVTTGTTITPVLTGETVYRVTVFARNKPTFERLRVRLNADSHLWECSWHIEREEKRPHFNSKTRMAEGEVMRVLGDTPWMSNGATPINPAKRKVLH
jgi:hypothetical protein